MLKSMILTLLFFIIIGIVLGVSYAFMTVELITWGSVLKIVGEFLFRCTSISLVICSVIFVIELFVER